MRETTGVALDDPIVDVAETIIFIVKGVILILDTRQEVEMVVHQRRGNVVFEDDNVGIVDRAIGMFRLDDRCHQDRALLRFIERVGREWRAIYADRKGDCKCNERTRKI